MSARLCACGCGQFPKRWNASYVAGHRPLSSVADRLWSKCKRTESGCFEFTGYCHPDRGYGQIGRGRKTDGLVETHRLAYELTHGPIAEGMVVRHRCDNPPCCEPSHLILGTHQDNSDDKVSRGRQARGFELPHTRVPESHVAEIRRLRAEGWLQREIAAHLGVSQPYVSEVLAGKYRRAS